MIFGDVLNGTLGEYLSVQDARNTVDIGIDAPYFENEE